MKDVSVDADLAVRRLVARYSQLVDDRDLDAAVGLFTEEGQVIFSGERHAGPEAIRAWLASTPTPTLHQVTNVVVSNGSHEGTLHAVCDLGLLLGGPDGWKVAAVGRYHDTLAGSGRDLRFTQRIITLR
ncbi:nuclear transport factor 2 family protein [Acidiferrimicrobium sp. IK]|uniref:nuclear transport factor 2 family protein n=1 Tax=Acidiferrimicrobium sp. IK TaxID=2871700 RepID=UPI0021CB0D0E|nr:nuclear transport factor 2 family protein [Acidiferrimicrobium sp. IK]MCU4184422.1 nuclear transport factor 2 family protein [Acidiferrimicrobium sp. IK]